MLAKVNACAVIGLEGVIVDVEVDLTPGIKPSNHHRRVAGRIRAGKSGTGPICHS
jgi:hypothetical protein